MANLISITRLSPIKAKKLIEIDETTISIRFFNKKLLDF